MCFLYNILWCPHGQRRRTLEQGDFVCFRVIVKQNLRQSYQLSLFLCLAICAMTMTGCTRYVRLPKAPTFPQMDQPFTGPLATYRKQIVQEIRSMNNAFWRRMESYLGLQHVTGQLFLSLELQSGVLIKCTLKRAILQARWHKPSKSWRLLDERHKRKLALYHIARIWKVERKQRRGPCSLFREHKWPSGGRGKVVRVDVLLKPDPQLTGNVPPTPRTIPPQTQPTNVKKQRAS